MSEVEKEFMKNLVVANMPGFKFNCSDFPLACRYCKEQMISFVTEDLIEAEKHSRENNVAMWISYKELKNIEQI